MVKTFDIKKFFSDIVNATCITAFHKLIVHIVCYMTQRGEKSDRALSTGPACDMNFDILHSVLLFMELVKGCYFTESLNSLL